MLALIYCLPVAVSSVQLSRTGVQLVFSEAECEINRRWWERYHTTAIPRSGEDYSVCLPVSHIQVRFHLVQASGDTVKLLTLMVQDSGCVFQTLLGTGHQRSQLLPLGHGGGGCLSSSSGLGQQQFSSEMLDDAEYSIPTRLQGTEPVLVAVPLQDGNGTEDKMRSFFLDLNDTRKGKADKNFSSFISHKF